MEIELLTTKKKLSMSIVKQMKIASVHDINFAMQDPVSMVLGYINNFKWNKLNIKVAIIKTGSDWALVPLYNAVIKEFITREQHPDGQDYHTQEVTYYYSEQKIGNIVEKISLTSKKNLDKATVNDYIKNTNELIEFAKGNHIYL